MGKKRPMMLLRIQIHIITACLIGMALVAPTPAQTKTSVITWYTGGDAKLNLAAIPTDNSPSVVLAGTTTQKTLHVKVAKNRGPTRSNPIPVSADGSFNVRYLLKDGIGTYTVTFFGSEQSGARNYKGLGYFTHTVNETLPAKMLSLELNSEIIEYINKVINTTVGSGECWDLAQEALDLNLADWTRPLTFGRQLHPENDEIKAGDIIQFRSVKITERLPNGGTKYQTVGVPDHTAIIYKVLGKRHYTVAHQNVRGIRSVITEDINLTKTNGGKYWIYRPVALMIQQ